MDSAAGSHLVELETSALRRWCAGDPSGFLELCADDVVYFDPFHARRIDGLAALRDYYESIRGQVRAERFELIDPCVQQVGEGAVLTFNFISWSGTDEYRWNCTEVFHRDPGGGGWRLIQTHWSWTLPRLAA